MLTEAGKHVIIFSTMSTKRRKAQPFPAALLEWRAASNLTQAGLGRLLGVTQPTICKWERGLARPNRAGMIRIRMMMEGRA